MRKLTFLLRPSWVILAVVVVAFAYLCFTVLAPWQLHKNTTTGERNDLIAESVRADPVPVTDVLDAPADSRAEWRRVTASGAYVPGSTVLVRLRHLDGAPGYAVLAAFRLDDGRALLVDRGLVAGVDGSRAPRVEEPPSGPQRLEARVRNSEGVSPDRFPLTEDGYRQVYSIDVAQAGAVMDLPLTPLPVSDRGGYLQLSEDQPGAFRPTPLPQLDAGPYLSYGLQWLAFGIMAPLGLGYFIYAEIRERRRTKDAAPTATPSEPVATEPASPGSSAEPATAESSTPGSVTTGSSASGASASGSSAESTPAEPPARAARQTTEARLADRYGRNR
ncbi:SURF1 family cytochrome oxidase biogenesis protein [Nocardia higoensis]|uniref:SURF1 family cytochrome oxidase biogenesis protein n=1 Tax=Nocardia higoensis TaxID=228599 RepID=UPI00031A54E2|nr:SURF1 family protein [Nocardia higoensis]